MDELTGLEPYEVTGSDSDGYFSRCIRDEAKYKILLNKCYVALRQIKITDIQQLKTNTVSLSNLIYDTYSKNLSLNNAPFIFINLLGKCSIAFNAILSMDLDGYEWVNIPSILKEVDSVLVEISTPYALLQACTSALALINISTPYAGMSTAKELETAIKRAVEELAQ